MAPEDSNSIFVQVGGVAAIAIGTLRDGLDRADARVAQLEGFLNEMLDPAWWREEVDVNGEYTTTRARGYYDVAPEIRAILGDS